MAEYKRRYSKEEKRKKLHTFNCVYYEGNPNDWKVSRLPDWMEFYGYSLQLELKHKQPKYYRKLKQRMIVMVNYGVTVGDEMGGRHFAVVLSSKDNKYKKKAIVVPLSSHYHKGYISLGNAVFNKASEFAKFRVNELSKHQLSLKEKSLLFLDEIHNPPFIINAPTITNYSKILNEIIKESMQIELEIHEAQKLISKLEQYKNRTYANPAEIRTISKMRISKFTKYSISGHIELDQVNFKKLENAVVKNI